MDKLKIGMLYICTGAYDVFFPTFYSSREKLFMPDSEKYYFVFTDSEKDYFSHDNITKIYQKNLGWPDNTLKRFHMFDSITDTLKNYDYLFFFNANIQFMMPIHEDILPSKGLIVVKHPGYYLADPKEFTYERNPKSLACINDGEGEIYVFGAANGGKSEDYIKMYQELKRRVDEDEKNGIIAIYHDESHLNRYIIGRDDVTVWGPDYAYPDLYDLPGYIQRIRLIWKQAVFKEDIWKMRGVKMPLKVKIREMIDRKRIGSYLEKREAEREQYLKNEKQ